MAGAVRTRARLVGLDKLNAFARPFAQDVFDTVISI